MEDIKAIAAKDKWFYAEPRENDVELKKLIIKDRKITKIQRSNREFL